MNKSTAGHIMPPTKNATMSNGPKSFPPNDFPQP